MSDMDYSKRDVIVPKVGTINMRYEKISKKS